MPVKTRRGLALFRDVIGGLLASLPIQTPPLDRSETEGAADHELLDLGGAFDDAVHPQPAQHPLYRPVLEQAGAAENLQAAVCDLVGTLRVVVLNDGSVGSRVFPLVDCGGEVLGEPPHRLDVDLAAGQRERHGLVAADRGAEGGPVPRMVDGLVKAVFGQP